eukprot:snap_masked-scaffold_21-processed-gene-5.76-mRNA-1 protein AED:0.10 eAED:1.00 QI:0/-1/0/1/-1/1/1/0/258
MSSGKQTLLKNLRLKLVNNRNLLQNNIVQPIGEKIVLANANGLLQEDCEYEYTGFRDCSSGVNQAIENVLASLTEEELLALFDLLSSYEYLNIAELGEEFASILGEGRFCTIEFIDAVEESFYCSIPTCINCDKNGFVFEDLAKETEENVFLQFGCGLNISVCEEITFSPSFGITDSPTIGITDSPSFEKTDSPSFEETDEENGEHEEVDYEVFSFYFSVAAMFFSLLAVIFALVSYKKKSTEKKPTVAIEVESKELL